MVCFLSRDDWRVAGQHEVDTGYGTRFVWNSVMSTFSAPSKRSDAVKEEMICPNSRFRLVYVGRSISRFLLQMSYKASLSYMIVTSVCSRSECTHSTVL